MSRTILESLALRYRQVLESLESLLGRPLKTITSWRRLAQPGAQSVCGGCHGANRSGGPTEATALGNLLVQASVRENSRVWPRRAN